MEHLALAALAAAVVVLVARDARMRRRVAQLERRAVRAEEDAGAKTQLAAVGQVVSDLAHELKTPLQGVLGNTEVMLATGERGSADELRDIHDNAARAADIVRNLVAFSDATTLTRRWQDLNDVCARAIDAARPRISAAGNSAQVRRGARLPMVYVDGWQLEKTIAALIGHAGAVGRSRRLTGEARDPIVVSTRDATDALIIDIDFPGVTREAVEHALAAGELDAGRHVIRAHGGRLTVDGRHASAGVVIELPAVPLDLPPSSPSAAAEATSQESSSPWTTLSTSSTSTATGTSRS